jgi:hypothetical protein
MADRRKRDFRRIFRNLTISRIPDFIHSPLPHYQYEALPSKSSFRVLELLPGCEDDVVTYRLRVADWNSPPSYEAISYAWGDTKVKFPTICNGRTLEITLSLRDGLRRMRRKKFSRFLWADAACIDQDNQKERGHQVSSMRKIYKNASNVLVWLGENEEQKAETAIKSMQRIASMLFETKKITVQELKSRDDPDSLLDECHLWELDIPVEELKALVWYFSRPWFSRLWVCQEINSGTDASMLCGSTNVDWELVAVAASYVRFSPEIACDWDFPASDYYNAAFMRDRDIHTRSNIPGLLRNTGNFKSSDPLDRIYALMGMPPFAKLNPPLEASYQKSRLELYREVAVRCILELNDLEVLECVEHEKKIDDRFPSWVPQWDQRLDLGPINNSYEWNWNAASDTFPTVEVDTLASLLMVRGVVVDVITEETRMDPKWLSSRNPTSESHFVLKFWRSHNAQPTTYITGEELMQAFAMVLCSGITNAGTKTTENRADFFSTFTAYIIRLLEVSGADPSEIDLLRRESSNADWHEYELRAVNVLWHRSFFATDNGYMGLGPNALEVGDVVCVLFGGNVPFILRPKNGVYQLVGEAYVHGIMEGEAIKQWEAGELKEQTFEVY